MDDEHRERDTPRAIPFFPPSPEVLQAGSSGALADGKPESLHDPALFGPDGDRWAHLVLAEPMIHPWLRASLATLCGLTSEDLWWLSRGGERLGVVVQDTEGPRRLARLRCITGDEVAAGAHAEWLIQPSLAHFIMDFGPTLVAQGVVATHAPRRKAALDYAAARTPLAEQVLRVLPLPPPVLRPAPLREDEDSATSILARLTTTNHRLSRLRILGGPPIIIDNERRMLANKLDDWLTYGVVLQARETGLLVDLGPAAAADLACFTRMPPPRTDDDEPTRLAPRSSPEPADWDDRIAAARRLILLALSHTDRAPPVWLFRALALEPSP